MNEADVKSLVQNAVNQSKLKYKSITQCSILLKSDEFVLVSANVTTQDDKSNQLMLTIQKLSQTIYVNEKDVVEAQAGGLDPAGPSSIVNNVINRAFGIFERLIVELRELQGIMRLFGIISIGVFVLLVVLAFFGFRTNGQAWNSDFAIAFVSLVAVFLVVILAIVGCYLFAVWSSLRAPIVLTAGDAEKLMRFTFHLENLENDSEKAIDGLKLQELRIKEALARDRSELNATLAKSMEEIKERLEFEVKQLGLGPEETKKIKQSLKEKIDELEQNFIDEMNDLFHLRDSMLGGVLTRRCGYESKQQTIENLSRLYDIVRRLPSKPQA